MREYEGLPAHTLTHRALGQQGDDSTGTVQVEYSAITVHYSASTSKVQCKYFALHYKNSTVLVHCTTLQVQYITSTVHYTTSTVQYKYSAGQDHPQALRCQRCCLGPTPRRGFLDGALEI